MQIAKASICLVTVDLISITTTTSSFISRLLIFPGLNITAKNCSQHLTRVTSVSIILYEMTEIFIVDNPSISLAIS